MKTGYREAQVVVAGGGATGVVAAIAAARQGADTLLVERQGFLGGMFTGGNMTVLTTPPVGGIGKEIVDALTAEGAARRLPDDPPNYPIFHYSSERCWFTIAYEAEVAKLLLFRMVREAGVRLLLHTSSRAPSWSAESSAGSARPASREASSSGVTWSWTRPPTATWPPAQARPSGKDRPRPGSSSR
jgi:phytoene dehydrogenase-like protein